MIRRAVVLLAILLAASGDDAFLAALDSKAIGYSSPADAVTAAHTVCDKVSGGEKPSDVAADVMHASNLDGYHAGFFVGAAIGAYCPDEWSANQ